MQGLARLGVLVGVALLLVLPAPLAFAMPVGPMGPPTRNTNSNSNAPPASHGGPPVRDNYSLTLQVSGSWYPDPTFNCPGQCQANDRFYGSGILTYYNETGSTSVSFQLNGTAHSNWAGVDKDNPCAPMDSNVMLATPSHDTIHMKVTGTDCETFSLGRWTGQNVISGSFTITSGEGLFSEANGNGTLSGYGYPRTYYWIADATGTISFVPM